MAKTTEEKVPVTKQEVFAALDDYLTILGQYAADSRNSAAAQVVLGTIQQSVKVDMKLSQEMRKKHQGARKLTVGSSQRRINTTPPKPGYVDQQLKAQQAELEAPLVEQKKKQAAKKKVKPKAEASPQPPSNPGQPKTNPAQPPANPVVNDGENGGVGIVEMLVSTPIADLYDQHDATTVKPLAEEFQGLFPEFKMGDKRSYKQKLAKMKAFATAKQ